MKAFVTGGTGFLGTQVIRKLIHRGAEVRGLARSANSLSRLEAMGVQPVPGDITDRDSMREGMRGCDIVYHIAGLYRLGIRDRARARAINIDGTRNVLGLGHELGVPRLIYTSSVTVFGDTHGMIVDEDYLHTGPFLTEYDRTKWIAHYEVALPLIVRGAPITIVTPGGIYGPGDTSYLADLLRRFYAGQFLVFPGPETGITLAHVEDVAEGHLLAAERGRVGESYILAGPPVTLGQLIGICARLTGRPEPLLEIPATMARLLAPLASRLEDQIQLPELFSAETLRTLGTTFYAGAEKAQVELGWETRDLEEGLAETLTWVAYTSREPWLFVSRERQLAGVSLAAALVLFMFWLLGRRRT